MKQTLDLWGFRRGFADAGRADNFSRQALETLFDYYEQLEEDCGIEIEFDAIAICCKWTEYTLPEMYADYSHVYRYEDWLDDMGDIYTPEEIDAGEAMEDFLEEMKQHTTVLEVTGTNTYLVMCF